MISHGTKEEKNIKYLYSIAHIHDSRSKASCAIINYFCNLMALDGACLGNLGMAGQDYLVPDMDMELV